jgi:parallel beta-helix repeat protein
LWDTWTVPVRQNNVLYVDAQIGSASCTNYDVATRSCGSGLLPAYRDLNAASGAANPGDTVLIRGATFTTRFTPQKSGSAGAPITFQNYPGETVTITLESGGMQPGIELTDRHYLVLNGINVDNALMWAQILNSTNNVFKNGRYTRARDTGSRGGFRLVGSDYNQIVNNVFEDGNDNLYLENSNRNRVEGNTLNLARHTLLVLACSSYNVIRANKLANTSQKGAEVFDCEGVVESLYDDTMQIVKFDSARRNLWEDNSFTATRASSNISDYNAIQYAGQEGIVRNNLFYDNLGGGLGLQVYNGEAEYNYGNRVYQNTFYANRCFGIWGGWPAGIRYENNVIVNNIIFGNRNCGNTGANDIQNNAPAANTFINNPTTDPSFLDAGSRFLRQSGGSPAINAGVFLTTVVGSGSGTQLPVADAAYFYDGMGIPGEVGDVIQLEGQTDRARIVAVNYATNTLTLDRALSWTAGQGVAQRYNGTAPDIGAYESP